MREEVNMREQFWTKEEEWFFTSFEEWFDNQTEEEREETEEKT